MEEVIGEIRDEYDTPESSPTRRLAGGGVELDGLLNLADFVEETGVTLPEGPYETVAGCLVAALGGSPPTATGCGSRPVPARRCC